MSSVPLTPRDGYLTLGHLIPLECVRVIDAQAAPGALHADCRRLELEEGRARPTEKSSHLNYTTEWQACPAS